VARSVIDRLATEETPQAIAPSQPEETQKSAAVEHPAPT
jgi:hypothetical protein